uniref:NADH-ubiquinone oxidoreductase chain 4 n=1 Tax=Onisimus nanseni TaxID=583350 RepID=D3G9L2_ONINA|nr:NADH dehydrogenase subunit 4 [Onisimus nanseni]
MLVLGSFLISFIWGEVLMSVMMLTFGYLIKTSDNGYIELSEFFEVDSVSSLLIILSLWIIILSFLGSMTIKNTTYFMELYMMVGMSLLFFLVLSFSFKEYLLFYLSFESCLIPIFLMILGWGYQPERGQAGLYMLVYTLLGSLPLFFMIVLLLMEVGSGTMHMILNLKVSGLSCLFVIMAFLVKFPMYGLHLWLFKAHVEAPVAGSMILAGVLLKLGGYGLIRVLPLVQAPLLSSFIVGISIWGGFLVSMSCLRCTDMKLLVASSSVVHMGSCIGGLFIFSELGYKGCVSMMIAHGLCSSGLFYLVDLVYSRVHSRSLMVGKGLMNMMPSFSLWWFLMLAVNMAAPPSMNLMSEILLIISLISWSPVSMLSLMGLSFFSAVYSLYLFSLSQHGIYFISKSGIQSGLLLEHLVILSHWAPLNFLILIFYVLC